MIQGSSRFVYRVTGTNRFVSYNLKDDFETDKLHVEVKLVDGIQLDIEAFKKWKPEFESAEFVLENGKYICGAEVEKMSKSKFNTINPIDLIESYGADTFRMYEMFLGPVEQSKPWDTKGIEGVHRFLKKLWRLFYDDQKGKAWTDEKANDAELKILHKAIKKIEDDTARFSFNTAVSAFMVCVNELSELKCHKKEILAPLLILIAPYAPHIAEELYQAINHDPQRGKFVPSNSILDAVFPSFESKYLIEFAKSYPISVNGKMRTTIHMDLDASQEDVEKIVLENDVIRKWTGGKPVKKVIYVKNKMVNVVI
jgi:leucyl-tRNA synthetase